MPYTHTTMGQLKTELSLRLFDSQKIFYVDAELSLYLREALRTFGLCSGFWRERGTLDTSRALAFYDVQQNLSNGSAFILQPTVTDQEIISILEYHLLESTTSQTTWTGTEMFTYPDLSQAVQNRRNQFLSDTGCVIQRSIVPVLSPPEGRQPLDQSVIDVRRAAWLGTWQQPYYNNLWRLDEREATAGSQIWSYSADTPEAFSIMAPPPLQMQLVPIPITNGNVELLTTNSLNLNPAVSPTVLGIPDQLTPAIKWGALSDLLGNDGVARDPVRAIWCEQRYQFYVKLGRLLPIVIHSEINGVPLIPCSLQEIESANSTWENQLGTPSDLAVVSPNMIALNPPPDGVYSVTLDVVRQPPLPVSDGDTVQVGREQLDMILDYAEHLALFKIFGPEWHAGDRAAQNFLTQSLTYNQRISAAARNALNASFQTTIEKKERPRRLDYSPMGVGAFTGA